MNRKGTGGLLPADYATFGRIGVPPELLIAAGVRRVTDQEAREFGITCSGDMAGVAFPYWELYAGHRVTVRIRRDHPAIDERGKPRAKYVSPFGDRRHLYFPPGAADALKDPQLPIVLVEAEKSVLALTDFSRRTQRKLLTVGLGGCYAWRGRIGRIESPSGERVDRVGPLPDLAVCGGRTVYICLDSNVRSNANVRQAQAALASQLERQDCGVLLCELPAVAGVNGPDDYIGLAGDEAMARVLDSAIGNDRPPELSDIALAEKFADVYGEDLRYTAAWARWSLWDGTRWVSDDSLHVFGLARSLCRVVAASLDKPQTATKIAGAPTVAAVERLARCDRQHAATVDQWDSDPWLLNTPDGIVDLRTGILRPSDRRLYCTKSTAVAPAGACPRWLAFLDRVTGQDKVLQAFLQRMAGYVLTGTTDEHALFFAYGLGANGKSVFLSTLSGIMGKYATTSPIETFCASSTDRHPTELAMLRGARLVTSTETEAGRRWAESKIKLLTGGDPIAARFMRQDFFQFKPVFKLLIAGNHKPVLRCVDEAMRRRFHLLPFSITIPPSERDKDLSTKLRSEWGGILQWALNGCLAWQREGLNPPPAVSQATADYLSGEDTVAQWIEERCTTNRAGWEKGATLFENWRDWCAQNQEECGSQKHFSQSLLDRGFASEKRMDVRGFKGIEVKK